MTTTCSSASSGPEYGSDAKTSSAAPATLPERIASREGVLVDQAAARGVHDPHPVSHAVERSGVEQTCRLLVEREMEGDEVRLRIHDLERRRRLDPQLAEALERHVRVVGDHAHSEAERSPRHLPADPAQAEDAERLPGELDPREACPLPGPGGECRVRLGHVAGDREQQRNRVLGRRHDGRLRRVRDHDPPPCRRVDVDVVDAHARAADHLQPARFLDERGVERRPGANDDRVELADDRPELGLRVLDDVEAAPEKLEPGLGDGLPDQDARGIRHGRLRGTPRALARRRRRAPRPRHSPREAPRPPPAPS